MKKNAKILIGDDSILARQQLKNTISLYLTDPVFIEAVDGKEAVSEYEKEKPDLTFLDIVMPVRDGILATLEITKKDKEAKIIIVSSIGTQKQLTAAVMAGAIDFVQKPVRDELIQQLLEKYLGGE